MSDKQTELVIAYFSNFDQADQAAKSIKNWDKANDDVKLGAIGVLHQTDSGKIKTKNTASTTPARGPRSACCWECLPPSFPQSLWSAPRWAARWAAG